MTTCPLILVTPCVQAAGFEMGDRSISLAYAYQRAILNAGGLPLVVPCISSRAMLAEAVSRNTARSSPRLSPPVPRQPASAGPDWRGLRPLGADR